MKIKDFIERTSVRNFDGNPMSNDDIKTITQVINNSPTSTNAQQFSAIIFTKQEDKDWFSKNNWGQKHIADSAAFILFIADRSRITKHIDSYSNEHVATHEFFRGIVDASIAVTYAQNALITMGYGTTLVGGVLSFADKIEEKYNLPKDAQVVVALSIGKATHTNDFKPKMNKVFMDSYDENKSFSELERYDQIMKDYYQKRGMEQDHITYHSSMIGPNASQYMVDAFSHGGKIIEKHLKIAKKN